MKTETRKLLSPLFMLLGYGVLIILILLVSIYVYLSQPHLRIYDTTKSKPKYTNFILTATSLPGSVATYDSSFTIMGTTTPRTQVLVNNMSTTSDNMGEFSKNVQLIVGQNQIITKAAGFTVNTVITRNIPVTAQENPATNQYTDTPSDNVNKEAPDNNSNAGSETIVSENTVNVSTGGKDLSTSGPADNFLGAGGFATIIISIYIYLKSKQKLSRALISFT
ncbi:MAG: hypothetical protein WCP14_03595 [bacterium]